MRHARIALLAIFATACVLDTSPGESEKVGQIVSVHKTGIMNKTWTATLVRGGFQNGSGVNGITTAFNIESDSLAALAEQYMREGTEVRAAYRTEGVVSCWRAEGEGGTAFLEHLTVARPSSPPER